jgi:hypothetical protein
MIRGTGEAERMPEGRFPEPLLTDPAPDAARSIETPEAL